MFANSEEATELFHHNQQNLFQNETQFIQISDHHVPFLMRSNRRIKRSRLLVSPEEGLVVETPGHATLPVVHKMIRGKQSWVLRALHRITKQKEAALTIKKNQNSILIFGKEKTVVIQNNQIRNYILESKDQIVLGFTKSDVSRTDSEGSISFWLKSMAQTYLEIRVRRINQERFKINQVLIKNQKSLWGSCSSKKNLHLNWRLIMAPKFASDYIILHELCHTQLMNHSPKYWKLVEMMCPEYKRAEKWLRDYGFLLQCKIL